MQNKALARGILWGVGVALVTCAVAWLAEVGQGGTARLFQSLALFLAAGSVEALDLLTAPLHLHALQSPEPLLWIFLFAYWMVLGGVLGWLAVKPSARRRAAAIVLVVGLAAWQGYAKQKLERDAEAAFRQGLEHAAANLAPILEPFFANFRRHPSVP